MNSPVPKSRIASAATADASLLTQVLLVRIVAGGGREAQLAKDLHALVPLAPAGAAWTAQIARLWSSPSSSYKSGMWISDQSRIAK